MRTNKFKMVGLLMCVAAVIMATSCNREDDYTSKIVGNWTVVTDVPEDVHWGSLYGNYTYLCKGMVWNVSEDGSIIWRANNRNYEGTWFISGDTLNIGVNGRIEGKYTGIIQKISNKELKLLGLDQDYPHNRNEDFDLQLKRI